MVHPRVLSNHESIADYLSDDLDGAELAIVTHLGNNPSWPPWTNGCTSVDSMSLDIPDSLDPYPWSDVQGPVSNYDLCAPGTECSLQESVLQASSPVTPDPGLCVPRRESNESDFSYAMGTLNLMPENLVPSWSPNIQTESMSRWPCEQCNHSFSTSQKLETHARLEKHRAFFCKQCNKGYSRRDTYVRHTAKHKTSELFYCEICQLNKETKAFKRKDHLRQHVKIHERNGRCYPSRSNNLHSSGLRSCGIRINSTLLERMTDR